MSLGLNMFRWAEEATLLHLIPNVLILHINWDDLGSRLDGGFAGPEYDGCV